MIPNLFHFCFGMLPDPGFGFLEYLSIRSAHELNRPDRIYLHYQYPGSGPWWEKVQEIATLHQVDAPREVFGHRIHHCAHRSDVLRLTLLKEHGGIYMDYDTLCLRPFTPLLENHCVMGRQGKRGLCNAVIMTEPNGEFIRAWFEKYRTFRSLGYDSFYDEHSVVTPLGMARDPALGRHITLLDDHAFFFPLWTEMHHLFESNDASLFDRSYCVHYWGAKCHKQWMSKITPENATTGKTNFARFVRRVLSPGEPDEAAEAVGAVSAGDRDSLAWSIGVRARRAAMKLSPGPNLRWVMRQARDLVWVPRLVRNLGCGPALEYVPKRLRMRSGLIDDNLVLLRSKHAAHPIRCRAAGKDLWAFDKVFVLRQYEFLDRLKDVGLVVDCGAGIGCWAAYVLTKFPSASLIALEADPDTAELLKANAAAYGPRCRIVTSAVWSQPGKLFFGETTFPENMQWRRHVRPARPEETATVAAVDLATLLEQSGVDRVSLLKLDLGGAEAAVLQSNVKPWLDRVDHLVVEVHTEAARQALTDSIASEDFVISRYERLVHYARPNCARS